MGAPNCRTLAVMLISAMPPGAAVHAAYLAKRLKQRFPELRLLVALWTSENADRARARLREAGVDQVATSLGEAIEQLRQLALPVTLELQRKPQPA